MSLLINPGSHIAISGTGWTNTYEKAREHAEEWLTRMHDDGLAEVTLHDKAIPTDNGTRWRFGFNHPTTGKNVALEVDGIDDYDAYERENIFHPRVYWAGSSGGTPKLEDWVTDGYEVVRTATLRPIPATT